MTPPSAAVDVDALAAEIDDRIRALPAPSTEAVRRVRRDYSRRLRPAPPEQVLALALVLVDRRRWVAYELRSGSISDVFVRGVPAELNASAVDAKRQISTGGAGQPIWLANGTEILYTTSDGTIMSVPVETGDGVFRSGAPRALFKIGEGATLDVSSDGQRFLINRAVSASDPPVTVIVNWPRLLTQ